MSRHRSPASELERTDGSAPPRRMRPRRRLRVLATLLLVALLPLGAACASSARSTGSSPFEGGGGEETVRVTIENRNFKDATVWAHWNGTRVRVGTVTGNRTETFDIRYWNDDVRFEIDFLAGDGYMGETIGVSPGDHLELVIRPTG